MRGKDDTKNVFLYIFFGKDLRGCSFVDCLFNLTYQVNKTLLGAITSALTTHVDDRVLIRVLVPLTTSTVGGKNMSLLPPRMATASWVVSCSFVAQGGKISLIIFILCCDDVTAVDFAYVIIVVVVFIVITIKIFVSP